MGEVDDEEGEEEEVGGVDTEEVGEDDDVVGDDVAEDCGAACLRVALTDGATH